VTFDLRALYGALDRKRLSLGMSWQNVALEVAGKRAGKRRRISASTITRTARGGQMEADGVLAMVRWVGLTFRDFTRNASLPAPARAATTGMTGRFDTTAFYAALDGARRSRGMTWRQVASQLSGFSPAMLTRLASRGRMSVEQVVRLSAWLGRAPEDFTYSVS